MPSGYTNEHCKTHEKLSFLQRIIAGVSLIPIGAIAKWLKGVFKGGINSLLRRAGKSAITDIGEEVTETVIKDEVRDDIVREAIEEIGETGITSVQHAVGSANQAQSVLDGINPKYFNPESRFGGGFYVGADADTIVAELAEHGNTAKYAISYDMNLSGQKVLDLTNPQVASEWGYIQNLTSTKACQNIGQIARTKGYNVIKFQSYRGGGINYVIYNNFESILSPRNVTSVG